VGHDEPIFLVDAGLTSEQRDLVARHVTLIPAPEGAPTVFLTPLGPLEYPADVAILLDADIIVVRPLTDLIEAARGGRVIGFVNNEPNHDRFFPEWGPRWGLGPFGDSHTSTPASCWFPTRSAAGSSNGGTRAWQ
jgi:hypothetical protein